MAKFISTAFAAAVSKSEFNASEWKPVEGENYSLKKIWADEHPGLYEQIEGDTALVTATQFDNGVALRLQIPIKDGSPMELKVSGRSDLEEGDLVKIDTITGQLLRKVGQADIIRYDGELADDEDEE